ncbi:hypothetical protein R3W88_024397 [Solanum pinnatisectum]|uniref:Uncharacterized protein n=1 Tax=Solanum pinnatisectum TaxID=50273 RepID=A0AAV9M0G9_9SOLN|nr:hypothetical protein R3W88_024397 [Solanum pinnatisectum]
METDPKSPDSSSRATVTNTPNITLHLGEVLVCINAATKLPLKLTSTNFVSWKPSYTLFSSDTISWSIIKAPQDKLILHAILASISEAIVPFIDSSKTSHHAWTIIQKTYSKSMGCDVSIDTVNATTKSRQPQHSNRGSYSNHNQPAMSHTNLGQNGGNQRSHKPRVICVKSLDMLQRNVTEPKKSYLALR